MYRFLPTKITQRVTRPIRIAIAVGALALVLLGWTWHVRDVPLSESAKSLLNNSSTIPSEQNGEYVLWGLSAPPGLSAREAGISYADWQSRRMLADNVDKAVDSDEPWPQNALTLELGQLKMPICSWRSEKDCLSQLNWTPTDIDALINSNRTLIDRYHELKRYPHFRRVFPARLDSPQPPYSLAIKTSQLLQFAAASVLLQSASVQERAAALATINEEMVFWRSLLSANSSLIRKLTAAAAVRNAAKLVSELASSLHDERELEQLLATVPSLTDSERSMTSAFADEGALQIHTALNLLPARDNSLTEQAYAVLMSATGLYRTNHTANLLADNIEQIIELSSMPSNQLPRLRQEFISQHSAERDNWASGWFFYNAIGKTLAAMGQGSLLDYTFQVHDCDGFIRLVNLKIRYRLRSDKAQSVSAFFVTS